MEDHFYLKEPPIKTTFFQTWMLGTRFLENEQSETIT